MQYNEFAGVYSLLLTPFNEDRSIDYTAYEKYVEWQASFAPQHLFAVCGSSEMSELKADERLKLATLAVKRAGDVPVFATANLEPSWYAQIDEVKAMQDTGVKGLVFVTKGYCNDPDRLYTYLMELASHTELPIMLYEFPGLQPHLMPADVYGKLAQSGKFVGIKDTTCFMSKIKEKIAVQGDTNVLQANIPYLYEAYEAGARGVVATPTTCGTPLFVKMWKEFTDGDKAAAKRTHEHICLLDNAIGDGFCASAKYLVNLLGVPMNWYTRGPHNLNPQRLKAIEVFCDWAKANGVL
ncbi:MAG: dihydrodipicolinate synthase family protein [Clostridia bacterium]|nr:dihydrodipicolinate synthase family protein [Clostridia bacterium]